MRSTAARNAGGSGDIAAGLLAREFEHGIDRALAQPAAADVDAGQPRRRGELDELRRRARFCSAATRYFSCISVTIERPSAVSSARLASSAASAASRLRHAGHRDDSVACRLPKVMVPVLSSSSVSTSPAASTARPDMASTLKRISRSMPAMPMADSRPPMVVGISVTSSATSTVIDSTVPE